MASLGPLARTQLVVDAAAAVESPKLFGVQVTTTEIVLAVSLVLAVFLEIQRRARMGGHGSQVGRYAENCKRLLKSYAPEAAGLTACLSLAMLLRARGDKMMNPEDAETWEDIKAQWPLLMTADTLLAVQAMLRLLALLFIVLRSGGGWVPLSEEATALWLGANVARVALFCCNDVYKLDGPLGGIFPVACEVAAIPILLLLSRGTLQKTGVSLAVVLAATAAFASRNALNLAEDNNLDTLFILAHTLDVLAALAFVLRSAFLERGTLDASANFTSLLMPLQQALAAYYFLKAFEPTVALIGAGLPFHVLQFGNVAAFGMYLGAALLHFSDLDATLVRV